MLDQHDDNVGRRDTPVVPYWLLLIGRTTYHIWAAGVSPAPVLTRKMGSNSAHRPGVLQEPHLNAILAGIFAVPLDLAVEIRDREGLGKLHAAIALDPADDVVGRGIKVRPAAMMVEFEFLAMRGHRRHDGFRGSLSTCEGRGGQNAAHDHA